MVGIRPTLVLLSWLPWLIAAEADSSPWQRLDPVRRTQILMALLGLLLLGFLLIMLVLVGGRHVRRLARRRPANRAKQPWYETRRQTNDPQDEPPAPETTP